MLCNMKYLNWVSLHLLVLRKIANIFVFVKRQKKISQKAAIWKPLTKKNVIDWRDEVSLDSDA